MPDEPQNPDLDWSHLEQRLAGRGTRYDSQRGWAKLERAMDKRAAPADVTPLRVRRRLPWAAIAAALLVTAGAGVLWRIVPEWSASTQPALLREVATAKGQRATVRLADGTRVELGVASKLRYAPEYGAGGSRDVFLEGQAYFDVVHDDRRPFTVHTPRAIVRDIGTKFHVRTYADAPAVEVVVAQGAVALKATSAPGVTSDSLVLTEAELGRLDRAGRLTADRGVDVAARLAWIGGRLVFTDTPLAEVVPELGRWYDADVRLADSTLAGLRYTASLKDEPLPQLLNLMAAALELRVERQGSVITLYARHRSGSR